ncbi:MAG: fused response regulator/phosphatase [Chitinispirillaceae bacterium]|nr:fused response regulator/phosphatase [Chitinispirillaceae bacterium]
MDTALQKKSETYKVLIIDDDITSVMMLEGWLQHHGYETFGCISGEEGIEAANNQRPDVILLDVDLGTSWGPDICRKLKLFSNTSEIPVLFLSANVDVKTKLECFEAGGLDYITKPYEPHEVLARVRTHIWLVQALRIAIEVQTARIQELSEAQLAFMPPDSSEFPNARFAVHMRQLAGAGGDFYDIIRVNERIYDYIVADVSGHNIGIALVTSALKTLFKQNCTTINSPGDVLSIINKVIPAVLQSGQYVSISWLRINRIGNTAVIINAGQPPVLFIPKNGPVRSIAVSGDIIGAFENVVFEELELGVQPGDRFLLYSDGIIETGNKSPAARENGIAALIGMCEKSKDKNLNDFVAHIPSQVFQNVAPDDDIVILGIDV